MDPRLKWNVTRWRGIKTMYVPYEKLWKPDIILVNNAVRHYRDAIVSTDIMTTNDGNITWLFSAIFKSSCQIRVRYYPFDDQECELRFASWSHDITEMDLNLVTDKGDLSSYMNNSEFDLLEMTATREIIKFPINPSKDWPVIVIKIHMHRRPLFYVFNHILPCVLISSMAILAFLMPPETGEKINMCITTILSMGVYLQSITESIPPTSEAVPLIGMYYVMSLFMVCFATFINVIILNVNRKGITNQGKRISWWMEKYILGYMASFVRLSIREPNTITILKMPQDKNSRRYSTIRSWKSIRSISKPKRQNDSNCPCEHFCKKMINNDTDLSPIRSLNQSSQRTSDTSFISNFVRQQLKSGMDENRPKILSDFETRFRSILKDIYKSLQQYEIREEIMDERKRIMWQWRQLATVVDRFLLVLFFFATIFIIAFFLVIPATISNPQSN